MSYHDFCNHKLRNKPRTTKSQQNFDLLPKLGKLTISSFDGSNRCTTQAWVHKLDTYFHINPITEAEAIKFATQHLDGEAHEWWYHGQVTLGHASINSYEDLTQMDLTQRLMDWFDKKDLEIHIRELAQLRQNSTPEQGCWKRERGVGSGSGKRIFSKISGSGSVSGAFFI
jgi:hypothetical protein